jgi:DNA polymerase-4
VKKIIHVDMDAYFAAVEIRENPALKGKPLIVGGHPQSRGVVSTCSYEARKYGIHSGMSSHQAWQLCKNAIFVYPNIELYKEVTGQIREIFGRYTDVVETMSMDEAYLDVTENKVDESEAVNIARNIKREILETTKLTCSAGVSYNKFLAKIGSELQKPDGLVAITPENTQEILFNLPIEKFYGIGKVTAARMRNMGINSGKDLHKLELKDMIKRFGKMGVFYYYVVRGIDERDVITYSEPKSISCETTFDEDKDNFQDLTEILSELSDKLSFRMQAKNINGQVLCLKIKYDNFENFSKSISLATMTNDRDTIYHYSEQLLIQHWDGKRKIRLLGIGLNKLDTEYKTEQLELWDGEEGLN